MRTCSEVRKGKAISLTIIRTFNSTGTSFNFSTMLDHQALNWRRLLSEITFSKRKLKQSAVAIDEPALSAPLLPIYQREWSFKKRAVRRNKELPMYVGETVIVTFLMLFERTEARGLLDVIEDMKYFPKKRNIFRAYTRNSRNV